jgi:uncharacterized protein YutE (UPF0331/DUF86 family)
MTKESKEQKTMEFIRRAMIENTLRQTFDQTLHERIERYLEINHQGIIGNHYFAAASSECIDLYRDGYFISVVMVTQAVNEGILKLVADRNNISTKNHADLMKELAEKNIISKECAEASERIWNSFRNDIHHMNPIVTHIPFRDLAKQNIQDIATIEKDIFEVSFDNGKLVPKQPKYWDVQEGGTVPVFLRLE